MAVVITGAIFLILVALALIANANPLADYMEGNVVGTQYISCGSEIDGLMFSVDTNNDKIPDYTGVHFFDKESKRPIGVYEIKTQTLYLDYNQDGKVDKVVPNAKTRPICSDKMEDA